MRKAKSQLAFSQKPQGQVLTTPWSSVHFEGRSNVEAFVEPLGDWVVIAKVEDNLNVVAKETSDLITKAVNEYERNQEIIKELIAALELCMECPELTWEAEHDAELVLMRAKLGPR